MRKEIRKRTGIGRVFLYVAAFCLSVSAIFLSACTDSPDRREETSGSSATQALVTGESVSQSKEDKSDKKAVNSDTYVSWNAKNNTDNTSSSKALWNSTNHYDIKEKYIDTESVLQYKLVQYKEKKKKTVVVDMEEIMKDYHADKEAFDYTAVFADDSSLVFYCRECEDKKDKKNAAVTFYAIPLKKGDDGYDRTDFANVKKLFSLDRDTESFSHVGEYFSLYADGGYILGIVNDKRYFQYDRKKDKLKEGEVSISGKDSGEDSYYFCGAIDNTQKIVVHIEGEEQDDSPDHSTQTFILDLPSMEWIQVKKGTNLSVEQVEGFGDLVVLSMEESAEGNYYREYGKNAIYGEEHNIGIMYCVWDFRQNRKICDFTYEDCRDVLVKQSFAAKKDIRDLYLYNYLGNSNGKMYFSGEADIFKDSVYETYEVIFSVDSRSGDIAYEEKIMQELWKQGVYKHVKNPVSRAEFLKEKVKEFRTNLASGIVIEKDELIFAFETTDSEYYNIKAYNLSTGKFRELNADEKEKYSSMTVLSDDEEEEDEEEEEEELEVDDGDEGLSEEGSIESGNAENEDTELEEIRSIFFGPYVWEEQEDKIVLEQ